MPSCIILFGGQKDSVYYNSVYEFNLNTRADALKSPLPPVNLNKHACSSYLNDDGKPKIMIAGGTSDRGSVWSKKVWVYDIDSDAYLEIPDMPFHSRGFYMAPFQGHMYFFHIDKKVVRIDFNDNSAVWDESLEPTASGGSYYNWFCAFNYD